MLSDFKNLISFLKENHFLFEVIEKIIPFSKFESTNFNLLPYWIHLFVSLYNNKVNFKIEISGTEYLFDFKDSNQEKIKIHLIFQDNLYISKSSFIYQKSLSNKVFYEGVKECNDDSSKLMYFLIMKMMNDINITRKYCNSLKSLYKRDNLENIYIDNFLSLNNLFNYEKDERIPLIAKCWTIVYSLSSRIINYLLKYSLDLERELLNSIIIIYNNLDNIKFDESIKFSNSMINYFNEDSILWKLQTQNDIYDISSCDEKILEYNIRVCEKEKNELKDKIYKIDNSIWSIQKAEIILDNYIKQCKCIQNNKIFDKTKKEFKDKFFKLIEHLRKLSLKNKEDKSFRDNLIENITSLINDEEKLKTEYYQRFKNCVDIFINQMEKEIKDEENIIKWPKYKLNENPNDFNNHQIYEIILWYSEISEIFSQLIKEEVSINEKINLSSKLLLIDEMKPVSKYLLDVILKHKGNDDNFNISSQNYNVIKSTLKAQFISKIFISLEKKKKLEDIAISFYNKIQNLAKLINDLMKREEIKNEKEIEWAFEKIEKYPFNFNIILPEFKLKDIIFLFINYEKNAESDIIPGPLLLNDSTNFQLNEMSKVCDKNGEIFSECFDEMINFIFLIYLKLMEKLKIIMIF